MKANILLHCYRGFLMLGLLTAELAARAQGPTIDPTFQPTAVYKPASVSQAIQQPDGKRLVLSGSLRAGNQPAGPVVRLLANSSEPDSAFTSNVRGVQGQLRFMVLLPSGKVLLAAYGALSLGPVTRQQLLLLNADGTPDAGFNANAALSATLGNNPVTNLVGQPDGKLVAVLSRPSSIGAGRLVRLLPDGTLDAAFQAVLAGALPSITQVGNNVVVQPDGKLIVPGSFSGQGVVRLLPTGAPDPTFTAQLPTTATLFASQVALQPDGKMVVTTIDNSNNIRQPLVRLLGTGAVDATFQPAVTGYFSTAFPAARQVQVQPDGKLLVSGSLAGAASSPRPPLVRLLPGGGLDTSFDAAAAVGALLLTDVHLLPNGQLLVVKTVTVVQGAPINRLVLLNANGSLDPSLEPRLFTTGQVNDVVQLPTGGYLIGGDFTEFNGVAAKYLARLSPTGVPDPTFAGAADNVVRTLLVQPDGKLLVGGTFEHMAGGSRVSLARLLPSGTLDTGFAPPFFPTTFSSGGISRVVVQPDGRVLAAGTTRLSSTAPVETWLRLLDATTGQPDLSIPHYTATDMVVQPTGKVVVAGFDSTTTNGSGYCVFRLLPSGALDPVFTPLQGSRSGFGGGPIITSLAQSAAGDILATGRFYIDAGPPALSRLYSFRADGQPVTYVADSRFTTVSSLAVQPNGRLLVGTDMGNATPVYGLSRLLSTLAPDPSFGGTSRPAPATVNRLLVQPDGAIMAAGSFTAVGGQAIGGLVRLLDANVLSIASQQLAARTQAWPVPAHGQLHLALDAASRPQRVELVDALGRVVLAQPTPQPALLLDTSMLPAGIYLLHVQYAGGPVARRVVLE